MPAERRRCRQLRVQRWWFRVAEWPVQPHWSPLRERVSDCLDRQGLSHPPLLSALVPSCRSHNGQFLIARNLAFTKQIISRLVDAGNVSTVIFPWNGKERIYAALTSPRAWRVHKVSGPIGDAIPT